MKHRHYGTVALVMATIGISTAGHAAELPETQGQGDRAQQPDHRLVRRRGAVLERDHPRGLGRPDHRRVRADRPRRRQGPADHAHDDARGDRFRRRRHLQDGGRRSGVRRLRPRRPHARHRDRASRLRGLGAGHGPGDGGEVQHQAPGARHQPAAGLLVPRAARRPRRPRRAARSACSTRPWPTSSTRSAAPRSACRSPRSCRRCSAAWSTARSPARSRATPPAGPRSRATSTRCISAGASTTRA